MMKMKTAAMTLGLVLAATGCATHKVQYKNPSTPSGGPTQSAKQSFFLWGMVGGTEVDLQKTCPTGISQIESEFSVGDRFLTILTIGLYSPMTVNVQCAGGVATAGDK